MKVAADKTAVVTPVAKVDRGVGRQPDVVGDAVFRILVIAVHEVELIVAAVDEPAIQQVMSQPRAPAPLRGHAGEDLGNGQANTCRQ
jgi:hypothetical protein